jgi:hypothetical protein
MRTKIEAWNRLIIYEDILESGKTAGKRQKLTKVQYCRLKSLKKPTSYD